MTCVLWSGLYHITGTDIVRALVFRFAAFGEHRVPSIPLYPFHFATIIFSSGDLFGSVSVVGFMVTDVFFFSFFLILGRPVRNMKKFEEGVFSDLRNLKPGHDACLEEPKVSITSFLISIRSVLFFFYLRARFFPISISTSNFCGPVAVAYMANWLRVSRVIGSAVMGLHFANFIAAAFGGHINISTAG